MKKHRGILLILLAVICTAFMGTVVYAKQSVITSHSEITYTIEESESGDASDTILKNHTPTEVSEDYAPTELP